jgi:hypothetical protein
MNQLLIPALPVVASSPGGLRVSRDAPAEAQSPDAADRWSGRSWRPLRRSRIDPSDAPYAALPPVVKVADGTDAGCDSDRALAKALAERTGVRSFIPRCTGRRLSDRACHGRRVATAGLSPMNRRAPRGARSRTSSPHHRAVNRRRTPTAPACYSSTPTAGTCELPDGVAPAPPERPMKQRAMECGAVGQGGWGGRGPGRDVGRLRRGATAGPGPHDAAGRLQDAGGQLGRIGGDPTGESHRTHGWHVRQDGAAGHPGGHPGERGLFHRAPRHPRRAEAPGASGNVCTEDLVRAS